jgi:hypothetical protein
MVFLDHHGTLLLLLVIPEARLKALQLSLELVLHLGRQVLAPL